MKGFLTNKATFYSHEQTGTEDDAYGDPEPVYGWVESLTDVPVHFEPSGPGYEAEEIGQFLRNEPNIFADPADVGHEDDGEYVLDVSKNDRVEIDAPSVEDDTFRVMNLMARALDQRTPEFVEFSLERLEDGGD